MLAQNDTKTTPICTEIDGLGRKTVRELHLRYREVFGEPTRSNHKQYLIRRIAWRLQALTEGELSERARERAFRLACDADLRLCAPEAASKPAIRRARRDPRLPKVGTTLTRVFQDRTITVTVLEHGFQYEDKVYKSLSGVARHISGTHWNGFAFFQLPRRDHEND